MLKSIAGHGKKIIITVTGASASGKDTLVDALLAVAHPDMKPESGSLPALCAYHLGTIAGDMTELVSHTTRAPRVGEVDGVAYHFVTKDVIDSIEKVEFTEYAGNYYALAASELANIKDIGIVIVDKHGVDCIKKYVDEHADDYTLYAFFMMGTPEVSRKRMLSRGDAPELIEKRLKQHEERNEYTPGDTPFSLIISALSDDEAIYLETVGSIVEQINEILKSRVL